jgi:glutamate N-acetyltransferase/amino-acid N-acetyltransferase
MQADEVSIEVALGVGAGAAIAWGCDLTAEYVSINADYHT